MLILFPTLIFAAVKRGYPFRGDGEVAIKKSRMEACTPEIFDHDAKELLTSWDSAQARGLWHWCLDSGVVLENDNSPTAMALFEHFIQMGDYSPLRESIELSRFIEVFMKVYLRDNGLPPNIAMIEDLRKVVEALYEEDFDDLELVTLLSHAMVNIQPSLHPVNLNDDWEVVEVKLLALLHLFPKDHVLTKVNIESVFLDLDTFYSFANFCQNHGIDWRSSMAQSQRNLVTVYLAKERAMPYQLEQAYYFCTPSPHKLIEFLRFTCRHQRLWASYRIPLADWALFMIYDTDHANEIPLPDRMPKITEFINPAIQATKNQAIFKVLATKYGVSALVAAMEADPTYHPHFIHNLHRHYLAATHKMGRDEADIDSLKSKSKHFASHQIY